MPKRQSGNKRGKQSNFAKLSIFQPKVIVTIGDAILLIELI